MNFHLFFRECSDDSTRLYLSVLRRCHLNITKITRQLAILRKGSALQVPGNGGALVLPFVPMSRLLC
jgi:hypothetical protein